MVAQQKQKAVSDGRQIFIYIQISDQAGMGGLQENARKCLENSKKMLIYLLGFEW